MNGAKQKSSEKQIWERIKSSRKDKCVSKSKVVGKANVGANQKSSERQMWVENKSGETV